MTVPIVCVLKSGGVYDSTDVLELAKGLAAHTPKFKLHCITDMASPALEGIAKLHYAHYPWCGWWSKMLMFDPMFMPAQDFFYLDLDCIITGDVTPFLLLNRLTIMRDVYRPHGLQSAAMFLPAVYRGEVWSAWAQNPKKHMVAHADGGDQSFLETIWLERAYRLQDQLPGALISYKANEVATKGVPKGTRIVMFHGRPKPRQLRWKL